MAGSYLLEIELFGVYATNMPSLEIWEDGVLDSTHSVSSAGTTISVTISYGGAMPSSLVFTFNDGFAANGRTIEIRSVRIDNQHINIGNYLSTDSLIKDGSATVDVTTPAFLFDASDPALSEFTTDPTRTMTAGNDTLRVFSSSTDEVFDALAGRDVLYLGSGNDKVFGNAGEDIIYAGAGNDLISGGDDNDKIYGGLGNDTLYGGGGNDRIHGEEGDDEIHGGAGNDILNGHAGADTITGGVGADKIHGGDDNDYLFGGDDDDQIVGGNGDDTIDGGAGADLIYGGAGIDYIDGGAGDDYLIGNDGADIISGGDDDDILFGGAGNNTLDGGAGNDTSLYEGDWADYTVSLSGAIYTFVHASGTSTTTLIENFQFADGTLTTADILTGPADPLNNIIGTSGDDVLYSNSIPVGYNQYILDVLTDNPVPISGGSAVQGLVYNPDTGNFYQYVNRYVNETTMNASISSGLVDGVTGSLTIMETTEERDWVINNLGADFGSGPAWQDPSIVGDTNLGDGLKTTLSSSGTYGTTSGNRPYAVEWDGDAILGANNDGGPGVTAYLYGGDGQDDLYGASGIDVFVFENASAFNDTDRIFDFSKAQGDQIDLSDILSDQGIVVTSGNVSDYVRVHVSNGLQVDITGLGEFFQAGKTIGSFNGDFDIDNALNMLNDGNLIV